MDFQSLSFGMRRIGWIRFWVQSILGVVVAAVLLFSNVVNNSEGQLGLAPGLSLTTISLILLLFSLWQGWLIVRTGRAIASNARPSRGQTGKLIKRSFYQFTGLSSCCLLYTSPSPRDKRQSRMPSSA